MKLVKIAAGLLAAGAMAGVTAGAHAAPLFTEGFDDFAGLGAAGWAFVNASAPGGDNWFQGNSGIFAAQAGADNSYAGVNFNSTAASAGVVDNWLISPTLALGGASTLTFYTQASDAGFLDRLEVRFGTGGGSDVSAFTKLVGTVGDGAVAAYPVGGWTAITLMVPSAATGRIAFRYTVGNASDASYVGIDSITVSAVPEPATLLMLGLGLGAVGLARRRQSTAASN